METSIGEYGKMMFEQMIGVSDQYRGRPDHWESIREKAEPLVRELVKLNEEMTGGGYTLVGYKTKDNKPVKTSYQRIDEAQVKMWGINPNDVKDGDRIFFRGGDIGYAYGDYDTPVHAKLIDGSLYVEHLWGKGYMPVDGQIIKVPDDFDEYNDKYWSDEYWLKIADDLGL